MIKKLIPYIVIIVFNQFLWLLFPNHVRVEIPLEITALILLGYFFCTFLKNIFNRILVLSWIIFYFLGILNINSVQIRTNIWNLEIYEASLLYITCVLILTVSLIVFENFIPNKILTNKDLKGFNLTIKGPFGWFLITFPFLLIINIFLSLGFFPILSGQSFVSEMYEYNYGILYGFKFIVVYTFCIVVIRFQKERNIVTTTILVLFLIFVLSVDGKRFMLLLSIITIVPILIIESQLRKNERNLTKINYTPLIIGGISIGVVYILINILRTGGDIGDSMYSIVENIPFGVEFKDYVHSYNTYSPEGVKDYNFELSALGSFLNSGMLEAIGLNKEELYQMGSQHAWMKLYNENFGIRLGIIAELYFAYGLFVLPLMIFMAYLINVINTKITKSTTYISRITFCILFGLMVLSVNGQATVFFGSLTIIIYTLILHRIFRILFPKYV